MPKSFSKSKPSVKFVFHPKPITGQVVEPVPKPVAKSISKPGSKSIAKNRSRHCSKQHKYDPTPKQHVDVLLGVLDTLLLSDCYKTKYLQETAAHLLTTDLPDYIPNFVRSPESMSLNAVNIQSTFICSADVLSWHLDIGDPSYCNRECFIKRASVDSSQVNLYIYPTVLVATVEPVFDSDDFDAPYHTMSTVVNHLNTSTLHDKFDHDPDDIIVNAVAVDNNDPTDIRGQ